MSDFNETYADAINSNSEERTSSMSDYSTSTTPNETQYQENTPTITPEIVDAEVLDDIDDADLVETNPVAALAGNFQDDERTAHPLAPGETNYTEQEARQATEDIKVKILHTAEAQYDLVHAVEKAFDGHIWVALGYPEGMKGWTMYCADNFAAEKIRVTGQQRTDLITGFTPGKITNRGIAALLGVSEWTVRDAKAKAGIAPAEGKVRDAAGKLRHVDAGSMSSEERRKKIVELSEEGAKQTDIADMLDVSQSTVSDTLRKDRMRRMSEGLEPAKIDNTDFDNADDDQPLDLDMGNRETDIRSYIDSFVSQSSDARGAINEMVHLLESDKWQPGGSTVSEIVSRGGANIFGIISDMCKMLRLLNIDVDNVFDGADAELDDTDNDWSRFIDGCTELAIVCQEITA
jgi:DNA-directed RNA polymerase specialized sigma24 family protein